MVESVEAAEAKLRGTFHEKHAARLIADAFDATMSQLRDERWFESAREIRFFSRIGALLRHHIEQELFNYDTERLKHDCD